ncbi:NAD-dependent epimerase/dehydratase family protein [uncultured Phenylobacterium sp.]|uniref:NAD-dependent epimerase/dehydratase family protein n=1 Tax=uncultured Phenylobacterium sp. TaxID=349273 RepID=UPI0025E17DE3|nr:NAD-dependent epimerase/dehydratase family protein [uncultured Phenylobacterium sp.]
MSGKGWEVFATYRNAETAARITAEGHAAVDPADRITLTAALAQTTALLVTAPPGPQGCPGLNSLVGPLAEAEAFPDWTGYLSTTGVYGDRRGGWVTEDSRLAAQSVEGARRVGAERDWLEVGRGMGLSVTVFRLPGIYGPGRSAFERLRSGAARRIAAPGQVFSRIHVDDLAAGLAASIARPRAGGIYNLCDDEPAPNSEVIAYAARLIGLEPPPELALADANLSPAAMRFYGESKRVSNARAKAELGWRPAYPTYREGLGAILAAEGGL